ncbi:hypothetical protein MT367_13395 [Vibrio parahaemolyticus]|jgi:hypothetical protein|uniref:hypothetical protein n=1 Tax=Vibrio harveyi group TaxID=717610 RepID=UPI0002C47DB2|nr:MULTISPECIES: hypothetical protein [Vibrio harveyi group]HDM8210029.1 hypothetical protein [Vibrio harveyi]EMR36461.1 hypothetical protein MUQ_13186 [Vibrio harveyi CAIM 1792]MDL2017178.1 hypothetical protein [Vibrio parahaemolyticus]MDL2038874.1 hypothetical protein [Vibrio parahaemolyticus]MDX8423770.1 hypothetical protein [Vibrio parahaemolyticus]
MFTSGMNTDEVTCRKTLLEANEQNQIQDILEIVFQIATSEYEALDDGILLELGFATRSDAKAARNWVPKGSKDGYGNLPWESAVSKSIYSSKRFVLAIKHNRELVGLVSGEVDLTNKRLILRQIERDASKVSFEGRAIPFVSGLMYRISEVFELDEIRIMEPAKGLIDRYKEFFTDAEEVELRPPYLKVPVYKLSS